MRKLLQAAMVIAGAILPFGAVAFGGAIDVPQQDARASGQAEAFAAQADDASAIYSNPGGLTQLHGTTVTVGTSVFIPNIEFHGTSGQEEGMHLVSTLPHFYAATDFGLEKWRFGLGVNNVYGDNEDWGKGPLQTLVEHTQLAIINIAPTVAYQITDNLSIGAAINVYYGDLELNRAAVVGPPPIPLGQFNFRGSDFAIGTTPGILWKIDDRSTVAAVYRSPFKMGFGGDATLKIPGVPEIGPNRAQADENFPQAATLAYAFRPVQRLKLEGDVVWTDWSKVKTVNLNSANPVFRTAIKENWKSELQYRLGVQYDLTRHVALRAGYAFGQNAVPSSTFSPLVPDSNYHLLALGAGYSTDNWSIDAAYQFIYRETRHISNSIYGSAVNGEWDNHFNEFMVTLTVKI